MDHHRFMNMMSPEPSRSPSGPTMRDNNPFRQTPSPHSSGHHRSPSNSGQRRRDNFYEHQANAPLHVAPYPDPHQATPMPSDEWWKQPTTQTAQHGQHSSAPNSACPTSPTYAGAGGTMYGYGQPRVDVVGPLMPPTGFYASDERNLRYSGSADRSHSINGGSQSNYNQYLQPHAHVNVGQTTRDGGGPYPYSGSDFNAYSNGHTPPPTPPRPSESPRPLSQKEKLVSSLSADSISELNVLILGETVRLSCSFGTVQ